MASNEIVCPKHGPYSAHLGSCPICRGGSGRPTPPRPLDEEDNISTDLGGGVYRASPAGGHREYSANQDDMPTDIPSRRVGQGRILDEDDEATNFHPRGKVDETELDFKPSEVEVILWVKEGNRRGKIYKVKDQDIIGSRNTDIVLDDPKVSKIHAKITCEEELYYIWDLGSRNGVFVNGERIRAATVLKENDTIKMGDTTFVIKLLN